MMLQMKDNLPDTERDCVLCADGTYVRDGHELICSECQHTPVHEASSPSAGDGPWEAFNRHRDEYSGFYGPERVKMVGGFAHAYLD